MAQLPTPPTPQLPLHIDSTMIACYRSCPQKFWLEFCRGLRPSGLSIDLHAGACFAGALEEVYRGIYVKGLPFDLALVYSHAKFLLDWGDFEIPEWKRTAKTMDRTWEAVEYYFSKWPPLTDHVKPYIAANGKPTLEYTFAIPLEPYAPWNVIGAPASQCFPEHPSGGPFIYCGRFDMLGSYQGRPCVRDEKTTGGSISTNWAKQWDLRSQFIGYVWACQQLGLDLETVVVRGIAIQKTQFVHEEAIKIYAAPLVEKWHDQLRRDLWRMVGHYESGHFDYNLADACTSYGSCVFLDACASPTPEPWLTDFEVRHWNPLNKNPTTESKS